MIYALREDPYLSDYDRQERFDTIVVSNDFCRAKSYIRKCKGTIAIDVEWHDQDPYHARRITEIGLTYKDHEDFGDQNIHIVITEHRRLCQKYVYRNENRKYKFRHGRIWYLKLETAKSALRGLLDGDYAIVGHGIVGDLRILDLGIDFSNYYIFDTQNFLRREYGVPAIGLSKAASIWHRNVRPNEWHNAGNDAYWTMKIFESMALE